MADQSGLIAIRAYRTLVGSRVRSQLAYRTSFWLNVATSVAVGLVEFIELYVILANVPVFGGLNLSQAALVFALANAGFALAELVFGQLDTMPTYLRLGRLEVMLVRPMPLMLQLITADFQLRRLGRLAISVVIIFVVLPALHLEYTASTIYLLVITPFVGAAIYAAFFATAGGLQFFLINGAEFTSAFVYGGSYAGQLPGSVLDSTDPGALHLRFSRDRNRVPAGAVDHGTARAGVPAGLVGLVCSAVRSLGLGAGLALLAGWNASVHRGWWLM